MKNWITKLQNLILPLKYNSDGYHSFDELYKHRYLLFIELCKFAEDNINLKVWRSKLNSDGTMFKGDFILGITGTPGLVDPFDHHESGKTITYHLPLEFWDRVDFADTLKYAPAWDGHTSDDVLQYLPKVYGGYL